ncbi:MAG: basic amino acid ABC transporter substrate-binding protein [Desulfovibrionales bacterium]|nr:MAG: basic amino acid ABC transporter substrate-binding protein [Desulfovibrionales bacterium]
MLKYFLPAKLLLVGMLLMAMSSTAWAQRTITFASDCTWPPMEMINEDRECVGFGPDLVNAMARAGGFEAVIRNTAWDGIFAGLAAGRYDAISSSVSITEERRRAMDFSDPYFEVKQGVVVRQDSDIQSEADLAGKTIGAQIGTTGYFTAMRIAGNNAKSYDEVGLAITDLANGRLDAVFADDAVAADFALTNPDFSQNLTLAFLIEPDEPEYLGFAVQKGDTETLELINSALAAVKASSEYDQIFKKWFGGE